MINELKISGTQMWKYVDDSTISETVQKNEVSQIQEIVDRLVEKTHEDKFQSKVLDPITINNSP